MQTPRLALPLVAANQAQKHVTVNEALLALDAAAGASVIDRVAEPPFPADPQGVWLVGDQATGAFAGHDGQLARLDVDHWQFQSPWNGFLIHIAASGEWLRHDGTSWLPVTGRLAALGVNAAAGAHKLTVSGASSLFDHAGGGHQLIINKSTPGETATCLFQTAYSGKAEIGLAGDNDLRIKVSSNGLQWREALVVDAQTGYVRVPAKPGFHGPLRNWDVFYGLNEKLRWTPKVNRASMLSSTADTITLPSTGLYQITLTGITRTVSSFGSNYLGIFLNGVQQAQAVITGTAITPLAMLVEAQAGDQLDVRNLLGSGARYWPETMITVVHCG